MEKEKQKAVERERLEMLRKQELEARKQIEDEARAVLNPAKSKFVSNIFNSTKDSLISFVYFSIILISKFQRLYLIEIHLYRTLIPRKKKLKKMKKKRRIKKTMAMKKNPLKIRNDTVPTFCVREKLVSGMQVHLQFNLDQLSI